MIANRLRLTALIGALASMLAAPQAAQAYPAARVDAQIRPNFGVLLQPPLRRPYKPHYHGKPDYRPHHGRPEKPWGRDAFTVNCDDKGPDSSIARALYHLRPGGTLYLRAKSGVCREAIFIDKPVTIVAQEGSFFDGPSGAVKIIPPAGGPCVLLTQGVKRVEIRGVQFEQRNAGRSACIEAANAELALVDVRVDYAGDASAVFATGGKLIMRRSVIAAWTYDAALLADNAVVDLEQVTVASETRGVDITLPTDGGRIDDTAIVNIAAEPPSGEVGLTVRQDRSGGGPLTLTRSAIQGFRTSVYVDRNAELQIDYSFIDRSYYGVVSNYGKVSLLRSAIFAQETGAYFAGGTAVIHHGRFAGNTVGYAYDRGTVADIQANAIHPPNYCQGRSYAETMGQYEQWKAMGLYCAPQHMQGPGLYSHEGPPGAQGGFAPYYPRYGQPVQTQPPPCPGKLDRNGVCRPGR